MADKFIVKPKAAEKKTDKYVTMTLRLDREIQKEFDRLAAQSDRSRNELMCAALQFALDHKIYVVNVND